jgi:hypothetical protein
MHRARVFVLVAGFLVAGCSEGGKYVNVSGVVRLNGEPYPNAVVTFQPVGSSGNDSPGRGSSGFTDASGRFVLKTDDGHNGAVVGKHLVRIMTKYEGQPIDPQLGSPDQPPKGGKNFFRDPIPLEWNASSQKTFDVPAGGTDKADFNIETKPAGK